MQIFVSVIRKEKEKEKKMERVCITNLLEFIVLKL